MTARVTTEDVKVIIDTSIADLTVFITAANLLVNGHLSAAGLSEEVLIEIEKYVAAHILSVKDPRTKSVGVDVLSESYQGQWGFGLKGTSYGQIAILLDTSGILGAMAEKGYALRAPSMSVIGYHE